ncbi:hypothetical protein BDZ97DRAFT_1924355 [Flammula alnicola]|nr:hypothetical protein BDZ97DRAFT_1924355 [Flammula alnicola]
MSNFAVESLPPGYDKRSSKADEFSVLFKSNPGSEQFRVNLPTDARRWSM